jgi:hypothetical protein
VPSLNKATLWDSDRKRMNCKAGLNSSIILIVIENEAGGKGTNCVIKPVNKLKIFLNL